MKKAPFVICRNQPKINIIRSIMAHSMYEGLLPSGMYITHLLPLEYIRASWNSMLVKLSINVIYRDKKQVLDASIHAEQNKVRLDLTCGSELISQVLLPVNWRNEPYVN